jgi:single-stranded-DNA-specific exonuclease
MKDFNNFKVKTTEAPPKDWQIDTTDIASKSVLDLLYNRGFRKASEIKRFLTPSYKHIPSPRKLPGALQACKRIIQLVDEKKKFFIHGDFDVDGISATSILWHTMYKKLGADVVPYIPSRVDEGYGLSDSSVKHMLDAGAEVIITVDCGIRDRELIEKYSKFGVEFIITDHHQPPDDISVVDYLIVHPNIAGKSYPYPKISGAMVVYLLSELLLDLTIKDYKLFSSGWSDLAGLSTVTDIMPLESVNRDIVSLSIKEMRSNPRLGMQALMSVSNLTPIKLEAYHYGFVLGPRINASGRIGKPMDAVRLLLTEKDDYAYTLAQRLDDWNMQRRNLTEKMLKDAFTQIDERKNLIFVVGKDWEEGIIGLVAGKIQEKFGKPTIVVTVRDGECRGSCRSIPEIDITEALEKNSAHLLKFGGHRMAGGFSLKHDNLDSFKKDIESYIDNEFLNIEIQKDVHVDLHLSVDDIDMALWSDLEKLKPYGFGNLRPLVWLENVLIVESKPIGKEKQFLKLLVKDNGINLLEVVIFDIDSEEFEIFQKGKSIDLFGYVGVNVWNDNIRMQFQVKGWRYPILNK